MSKFGKLAGTSLAILFYAVLAVGSTDGGGTAGGGGLGEAPEPKRVEYQVSGAEFDLTYENADGNTEQLSGVSGPWSRSFTVSSFPFFAYVSAQNQRSYGEIVVEIYVEGQRVERARSTGEYVIATASTSVD